MKLQDWVILIIKSGTNMRMIAHHLQMSENSIYRMVKANARNSSLTLFDALIVISNITNEADFTKLVEKAV